MSREFRATIYGEPVPRSRPQARRLGRHAEVYNPAPSNLVIWRDNIARKAQEAITQGFKMIRKPIPVSLSLAFYFNRPKSKPKKQGDSHIVKPDLDNLTKLVKDALSGVIIEDDSQVDEYVPPFLKRCTTDQPRVEIILKERSE